jgi:hypothetical protein
MKLIDSTDFLISVSTYRPFKLDFTYESILQVFAENESSSVYQVFKRLTDVRPGLIKSGLDYKNVHVRIKRLVELKQIEQLKKHFERGAIHYRITTNGLISYLSQITDTIDFNVIKIHKDNILMKDLIYQIFEEKTINSLYDPEVENMLISPVRLISDYIRDCCRAIFDMCTQSYFSSPELEVILPSDKIIQDYLAYLVGKPVTNIQIIDEAFKEYEMKLEGKMDDPDLMYLLEAAGFYSKRYSDKGYFSNPFNRNQKIDDLEVKAPFPIFDLFKDMFQHLFWILSVKVVNLVLQMIYYIGDVCDAELWVNPKTGKFVETYYDRKTGEEVYDNVRPLSPEDIPEMNTGGCGDAIEPVVKDNKFKDLVDSIQGEYSIGVEIFKEGKLVGMKKPN